MSEAAGQTSPKGNFSFGQTPDSRENLHRGIDAKWKLGMATAIAFCFSDRAFPFCSGVKKHETVAEREVDFFFAPQAGGKGPGKPKAEVRKSC